MQCFAWVCGGGAGPAGGGGECCPPGSWPALVEPDEYKPKGSECMLGDLKIYAAGKPGPKAIVVLPEVFGWSGRLKGICDTFADHGYYVIMPDCHRGDTAAGKENIPAWVATFPYSTVVGPDFKKMMDHLSGKGATSVGSIGFCWGVWALCKASAEGVPLKCGVGPHPSTKLEGFAFKADEGAMMAKVNMPVLLMPASNDPDNVKPGGEFTKVLESKGGSCVPFPDMTHGWASRGDVKDPKVKRDVEEVMKLAIDFFKKHL